MMDTANYYNDVYSVEAGSGQFLPGQYSNFGSDFPDICSTGPSPKEIVGLCDSIALEDALELFSREPNEVGAYLTLYGTPSLSPSIEQNEVWFDYSSPAPTIEAESAEPIQEQKKSIVLSASVAVGTPVGSRPRSGKLRIAYELEMTYRARYKTDYFGQNGRNRKPRYVADRHGNHFVTIQVAPRLRGSIRVDWVTVPDETDTRYTMPYRFQASNESMDVSDCNPIYQSFQADAKGTVKLYLVLIKTKQDTLKSLQPLQPFRPLEDAFGRADVPKPDRMVLLTPKKLIEKYQLKKSQLAFTFCAMDSDQQPPIPEWDTTVYSTTMEEEVLEQSAKITICCPQCTCVFQVDDDTPDTPEPKISKRKPPRLVPEPELILKKRKPLPTEILPIVYSTDPSFTHS